MFIIRMDMSKGTIRKEDVTKKYKLLGGRSIITQVLVDEVDPMTDPLGKDNKLIIATGLLSGTHCSSTGRISIGCKSPLTGTAKEANAGGTVGQLLSRIGIKAIIAENMPEKGKWYLLHINGENVELLDGSEYVGKNNYEVHEILHERYGEKAGVISIGVGGERKYKAASIQVTSTNGTPSRAAARGGVGAVMGSKGIKAIVIEPYTGPSAVTYIDRKKFLEANKVYIEGIKAHPLTGGAMPNLGTASGVSPCHQFGILPVNNFSSAKWNKEFVEAISGEHLAELQAERGGSVGHPCMPGCAIHCSNTYMDKDGKYITSGFEYETIALFGSNCGIHDLDAIARMDRMCDEIGVDTMEVACAIAVAMDAGMAKFGDVDAALAFLQEIWDGTEFGRLLGDGTEQTGKFLGAKRIPTVKGQSLAGYDPRSLKGTGVTYATCPQGADHTAGNLLGNPFLNPLEKPGSQEQSRNAQIMLCAADIMGMCIFGTFASAMGPQYAQALVDMMDMRTGDQWTFDKIMQLGLDCIAAEKEYNRKAGIGPETDRLPDFFYTEPNDATGTVFDFTPEELAETLPY